MKKYIIYIGLVLIGMVTFSCNKDSFNYKTGYVGISKITHYALVVTNGQRLSIIAQGAAFVDSGATTTLNNAEYKYTTSGSVDASKPGVYHITYSAINSDGFSASDFRTVVVIGNDVSGNDFSGTYGRYVSGKPNGVSATWTKIANGVYSVDNPVGAAGVDFQVIVVNYTGTKITIPEQLASDGSVTSSNSEATVAGPNGTLKSYDMAIVNGGYGAQVRNFIK